MNTEKLVIIQPEKLYPLVITVDRDDGSQGTVSVVWNKDTARMELEVYNAELDQAAKVLFNYVIDYIETWQEQFHLDALAYERKFALIKG